MRIPHGLASLATNFGWLSLDRVLRLGVNAFLLAWVVRYLGMEDFGRVSFALAMIALFGPLTRLGMPRVMVVDLVRHPRYAGVILGSAVGAQIVAVLVAMIAVNLLVRFLRPDDRVIQWLTFVLSLGLIPQLAETISAWFESRLQVRYTVVARNVGFAAAAMLTAALVLFGAPLSMFGYPTLLEAILMASLLVYSVRMPTGERVRWAFSRRAARGLLRRSWPIGLSAAATAVYSRVDQIMIAEMLGDAATGSYAAAVRLAELWYFIPSALIAVTFPAIIRARGHSVALYERRLALLYEAVVLMGLSVAIFVSMFANAIAAFAFGSAFRESGEVLKLYAWAGVAVFLGGASSSYLVTQNLTKIALIRTLFGAVLNVLLNLILIPRYGTQGAAAASLIALFVAAFSLLVFPSTARHGALMVRSLLPLKIATLAINTLSRARQSSR